MAARRVTCTVLLTGSLAGLAACAGTAPADGGSAQGDYLSADVLPWKGDLIRVRVAMKGAADAEGAGEFARCAAAGYAVKNKAGFARHVRTLTDKEGGIWRADAVYSVTAALPDGVQTIDAEVTVADCAERGIPTGPVAAKDKTAA